MRRRARLILIWSALAVYVCLLLTLTHMPRPPGMFEGQNDKNLHFLAYFVLASLMYVAAAITFPRRNYLVLIVLLIGIVFGAIDETTQTYFGRHSDLLDFRADVIGLITGITPLAVLRYTIQRRVRRPPATQV